MWTIWREEFYKIASRKIIWLGIFLLLSFVTFRLAAERDTYTITRDGERFWGKEAVKKDRELTAALAGRLTEEKIRQIYDQYGFFYYDFEGNRVGNFCNRFITEKFTNFMQTDGNKPEEIQFYQGEEWEQNVVPYLEQEVQWDYVYGWNDLSEMLWLSFLIVLIILSIGLSPVFAEEYTLGTADILLTTRRGKQSGIWMKMLAALFFSILLTATVILYLFGIYLKTYGTQGLDASAVLLNFAGFYGYIPKTVQGFFLFTVSMEPLGVLLFTGIVMGISAWSRSAFLAVIFSLILLVLPIVWVKVFSAMWIFGVTVTKWITHFMVSMPVYLSVSTGFAFSKRDIMLHILLAMFVGTGAILFAYRRYRNYQG